MLFEWPECFESDEIVDFDLEPTMKQEGLLRKQPGGRA